MARDGIILMLEIHRPPLVSFMLTDEELEAYSRSRHRDSYYYRYDKEKYPATEKN